LDCFNDNGDINNYINVRNRINYDNLSSKYINYIPVVKNEFIKIPGLYKNKLDFSTESEYTTHLQNCIDNTTHTNINDIRSNIINQYKGVCTNHLLIFKCGVSKANFNSLGVIDTSNINTDLYYIDHNEKRDDIWNDGQGYLLTKREIYFNSKNLDWINCYNIIKQYYDIKIVWKGSNTPEFCNKLYLICVSKQFGFNMDLLLYNIGKNSIELLKYFKSCCMTHINDTRDLNIYTYVYKDEDIFVPCYHDLEELNAEKIQDIEHFTISDQDVICVVPTIEYSKNISEYSWEFINMSDPKRKSIKLKNSIMEPFIANTTQSFLDPGYYSIKFRYKYGDKTNTIALDSAFKKI
jgi:hypothetical protein